MPTTDSESHVPMCFETLKDLLGQMYARGGDSDLSETLRGVWINGAEKFIVSRCGAPKWLQCVKTIELAAGETEYNLPISVQDVRSISDRGNIRQLSYVDRDRWSSYIVDPSQVTGTPLSWTKFEYVRRDNTGSPESAYGQIVAHFWPEPSGATTLYADCQLRPGAMVYDSDFPVVPSEYHFGLLELALMYSGAYDIGTKAYAQHRDMAMQWLAEVVRAERRDLAGNLRMVPREEHTRRQGASAPIGPPTRRGQSPRRRS